MAKGKGLIKEGFVNNYQDFFILADRKELCVLSSVLYFFSTLDLAWSFRGYDKDASRFLPVSIHKFFLDVPEFSFNGIRWVMQDSPSPGKGKIMLTLKKTSA